MDTAPPEKKSSRSPAERSRVRSSAVPALLPAAQRRRAGCLHWRAKAAQVFHSHQTIRGEHLGHRRDALALPEIESAGVFSMRLPGPRPWRDRRRRLPCSRTGTETLRASHRRPAARRGSSSRSRCRTVPVSLGLKDQVGRGPRHNRGSSTSSGRSRTWKPLGREKYNGVAFTATGGRLGRRSERADCEVREGGQVVGVRLISTSPRIPG